MRLQTLFTELARRTGQQANVCFGTSTEVWVALFLGDALFILELATIHGMGRLELNRVHTYSSKCRGLAVNTVFANTASQNSNIRIVTLGITFLVFLFRSSFPLVFQHTSCCPELSRDDPFEIECFESID
jgi:hypothetical protein